MTFWNDPIGVISQLLMSLLTGWGLTAEISQLILYVIGAGILAMGAMLYCIFLIWLERKVVSRFQDRIGPNRVGPFGLFQPFADMLKIFTKELITPKGADLVPYNLAPVLAVGAVLMVWAVLPLSVTVLGVDLDVGVLFVLAAGGLGELGLIFAGWGSNNKYALMGAFRAVAQLISYEIPMIISLLVPVLLSGSMKMNAIVKAQDPWFILLAPVPAFIFFLTQVAEVGRAPFNLIEAESEIVAGFNIEYSGLKFGMFYVGEFLHAFTVSMLFATLFLGGWRGPGAEQVVFLGFIYLVIKTSVVYYLVLLFTYSLPRLRIDQMMDLNWKVLTPVSLAALLVIAVIAKLASGASPLVYTLILLGSNVVVGVTSWFIFTLRLRRMVKIKPAATEQASSPVSTGQAA